MTAIFMCALPPLNDGFVLLAVIGVPCQFSILTWRTSKAT